jgi:hypothetical protein
MTEREEFLNSVATLGLKSNASVKLRHAVMAEIAERTENVENVSGLLISASGCLQQQINNISGGGITTGEVQTLVDTVSGTLQTSISTVSGTLETRIAALEQEVTRLQTELSLHEHNGMHWTAEKIDQRAQALIDSSSSN